MKVFEQRPTLHYTEVDDVLELHADDGRSTKIPEVFKRCLLYLGKHNELRWID